MATTTTFSEKLMNRWLTHLCGSPEGRAHMLNQVAEAESNGESTIFERALARVDDPELAKMIRVHQADEVRHAALFHECLARTGIDPGPAPPELRIIDRLDRALDGFFDHAISDRKGVMEAYLLLQVIEERAVTQFPVFERGFRAAGDAHAADTFAAVARDEERHLRYCHAIARRYAPDTRTHDETLARFRTVEAQAFQENGRANMQHTLRKGWTTLPQIERPLWWALTLVMPLLPVRGTSFGESAPAPKDLTLADQN